MKMNYLNPARGCGALFLPSPLPPGLPIRAHQKDQSITLRGYPLFIEVNVFGKFVFVAAFFRKCSNVASKFTTSKSYLAILPFYDLPDQIITGTIRYKQPFPGPGYRYIGQFYNLRFRPSSRVQPFHSQQEHTCIVESLHACRGDIVGSLGPAVFGDPVVQDAHFVQRLTDSGA